MRNLHQFGKSDQEARRAAQQVRSMIEQLKAAISILDTDIDAVEAFERKVHPAHKACPIAARTMKIRRDNLTRTISTLEEKLHSPGDAQPELTITIKRSVPETANLSSLEP
jgi:hypothetical protein